MAKQATFEPGIRIDEYRGTWCDEPGEVVTIHYNKSNAGPRLDYHHYPERGYTTIRFIEGDGRTSNFVEHWEVIDWDVPIENDVPYCGGPIAALVKHYGKPRIRFDFGNHVRSRAFALDDIEGMASWIWRCGMLDRKIWVNGPSIKFTVGRAYVLAERRGAEVI